MGWQYAAAAAGAALYAGSGAWGIEANRRLTHQQWQFGERMSSTAHQREVEDLRAAGLNPMLSAKLGGASTPSASGPIPQENIGGKAVEGAAQGMGIMQMKAQTNLTNAQAVKTGAEAELIRSQIPNTEADTGLKINSAAEVAERTLKLGQEIKNLKQAYSSGSLEAYLNSYTLDELTQPYQEEHFVDVIRARMLRDVREEGRVTAETKAFAARELLDRMEAERVRLDHSRGRREAQMYDGPLGAAIPYVKGANSALGAAAGAALVLKSMRASKAARVLKR